MVSDNSRKPIKRGSVTVEGGSNTMNEESDTKLADYKFENSLAVKLNRRLNTTAASPVKRKKMKEVTYYKQRAAKFRDSIKKGTFDIPH